MPSLVPPPRSCARPESTSPGCAASFDQRAPTLTRGPAWSAPASSAAACATLRTPAPVSVIRAGRADVARAAHERVDDRLGRRAREHRASSSATAPVTCGAANDVPETTVAPPGPAIAISSP